MQSYLVLTLNTQIQMYYENGPQSLLSGRRDKGSYSYTHRPGTSWMQPGLIGWRHLTHLEMGE